LSFRQFVDESRAIVIKSLESCGYEKPSEAEWLEPPDKSLGDIAFRVAFDLAKKTANKPGEIAEKIASNAKDQVTRSKYVASLDAHLSGFLNAKIKLVHFARDVLANGAKKEYGKIDLGSRQPILIEHTSVNPNKALHVGHLRNVAIGDCLARVFSFANYATYVLNYIDDSGLQVADVIVGFRYLGFPKEPQTEQKYDHYAGDTVYVTVTKRYENDPSLLEKQKQVLKAIELHEPEITKLRIEITERILKEQLKTCWRFGATYDLFVYESDIIGSNLWSSVFEMLKEKGVAKYETEGKLAGCWIVSIPGETEGEDKVLVRSDGTATYVAKDTPLAALKLGLVSDPFSYSQYAMQPYGREIWRSLVDSGERKSSPVPWGNQSLTVIDSRQARLQRVIQYLLSKASNKDVSSNYRHVGYAIISLSARTAAFLEKNRSSGSAEDGQVGVVTMSGRHGTYVNADDAMDAVKNKALEETQKRNPEITDKKWFNDVSEKVAISAIRFSMLKQDLDKMIIFDLEDSLKLIGETGPYLLYSYARASNIISKLGTVQEAEISGSEVQSPEEIALIKTISRFDIALEKTVKNLAPKWLAHYSFSLCESFNSFYEAHRVLQETDPATKVARIALIQAFRNVLSSCLKLLGIEATERI
jgi:arginyl-tRNA synthetase